jgi:RNA polymerase-interacting CarD/CdnL/TRCF family regulator
MRLAVGDVVVYGVHGAGPITARLTRDVLGERQEVIVLALAGGLAVELPLPRAEELLRPVADETELTRVQEALSKRAVPSERPWLSRRRDAHAKMSSSVGLAEIVRDGVSREDARTPVSRLSSPERELVSRARELLANEIALSRGVAVSEANRWIDEQLAQA